jgi:serine O-acetyltransferase
VDPSLRGALQRDLTRWVGSAHRVGALEAFRIVVGQPGGQAAFLLRVQMACQAKRRWRLARAVSLLNLRMTGAEFVVGCRVGPGLVMRHPQGIVVGGGAVVGVDCTILHRVTIGERYGDGSSLAHPYPTLGNRVVVGAGAAILGDVRVGDEAVIGANAVVLHNVVANDVFVGVPARSARQIRVVAPPASQTPPDSRIERGP